MAQTAASVVKVAARFCAVLQCPAMHVGVRTEGARIAEIAYLPTSVPLAAPRNRLAERAARQLDRYLDDPDARFELPLAEAFAPLYASIRRAALLLLVGGVVIGRLTSTGAEPEPRVVRSVIPLPVGGGLATAPAPILALSPDGSTLVYAQSGAFGGAPMALRPLDGSESRPILGTEGGVAPVFSPDGSTLLFRETRTRAVYRVPVEGGTAQRLALNTHTNSGMAWGEDGVVLYRVPEQPGILALDPAKSEPGVFIRPDTAAGELTRDFPDLLPGGEAWLVTFVTVVLASAGDFCFVK